ncbi:Malate dehydrogenase 1 [Spironucleus salmonicida]|uniref:malate dehydrogenase n=1 Tax=Spironucleus salmonicida TaxID=348837 RepID=K7RUK8_9EUKA|nr:malate dehydrogenase 1 [Spironucleus salmonicida]KAH0576306.1 Malate dehydrogenase 1 [Spironucleus salmonicida]|eukprot:EST44412.1 Malate dehydrogenase 1 [Spironucleus salmonicida]
MDQIRQYPSTKYMKSPINVTVSGGAGQIAYSLVCELGKGWVFGNDQPVNIVLLEVPQAEKFAVGVQMELVDCAFPLLNEIRIASDAEVGFKDCDAAILLGAFPRGPGMERADLLAKNAAIFEAQGKAIQKVARDNCRILVVGNPANTNARILYEHAPRFRESIAAMSRLDHNRMVGQVALKMKCLPSAVKNVFLFGNHSPTMVPVFCNVEVNGEKVLEKLSHEWVKEIIPVIQQRGTKVIEARGKSSAMSAAHGALTCMHDWFLGTKEGEYTSVSIIAQPGNFYDIPEGIFCSVPCVSKNGKWVPVKADICPSLKPLIEKTIEELLSERKMALGK